MKVVELQTKRLILRGWQASDRAHFARLNADPKVSEFLGGPVSAAASDESVERIEAHFAAHGFGMWAVEIVGVAEFAGFVGLRWTPFPLPDASMVEIGWRLASQYWNQGYATEGARAAIQFGFGRLALPEIVSFTVPANLRSRRVMEKLGMTHDPRDDFDHPLLPPGHLLRPHVLYRLRSNHHLQPARLLDGSCDE